jgi:membrane protease YdiL (CAAX protease family)
MDGESPASDLPVPVRHATPTPGERLVALIQVALCSDFPTQIILGQTFLALGYGRDSMDISFVTALLLADTVLLLGMIWLFLRAEGERASDLLTGGHRLLPEIRLGVLLTFAAFAIGAAAIITVRSLAPSLHDVEQNPLQELIHSPFDAVLFGLVAVVAGGVREEVQRAFLLSRFERTLGGSAVGVVVTSVAFGLGHRVQGYDAVVATGLLGAFWAIVFLRRRSSVAAIVSHAGFNFLQLAQLLLVRRL